jgi:hypothetical protein
MFNTEVQHDKIERVFQVYFFLHDREMRAHAADP